MHIELNNGTKVYTVDLPDGEVAPGIHYKKTGRDRVTQTIKITYKADLPVVLHLDQYREESHADDSKIEPIVMKRSNTRVVIERGEI